MVICKLFPANITSPNICVLFTRLFARQVPKQLKAVHQSLNLIWTQASSCRQLFRAHTYRCWGKGELADLTDSLPTILCTLYQALMLPCTHSIHSTALLSIYGLHMNIWPGLCKHTAGILVSAWPVCGVDVPVMSSRCQCFNTGDFTWGLFVSHSDIGFVWNGILDTTT